MSKHGFWKHSLINTFEVPPVKDHHWKYGKSCTGTLYSCSRLYCSANMHVFFLVLQKHRKSQLYSFTYVSSLQHLQNVQAETGGQGRSQNLQPLKKIK